jgi:hypothetical protein
MSESKDPSQISVLRPIRVGILSSSQTSFPQPNLEIEQPAFPQSSPKINFVPLFLSTSSTLPSREEEGLRWELVRLFDDFSGRKSEAILSYLASEESHEVDAWFRDDLRIAWLTVLHAASDMCDAWGYSFWSFFGKTYPKALKEWAERDRINRKALERCAEMVRAEKEQSCVKSALKHTAKPESDCLPTQVAAQTLNSKSALTAAPLLASSAISLAILKQTKTSGASLLNALTKNSHLHQSQSTDLSGSDHKKATNLYDSARAELDLPPKKPVRNVKADKKREGAA